MITNEIRKRFLDFFKEKEHKIIESDSLVPKNDKTVLFTTAGMQQFKEQFLGNIDEYTRVATVQKCMRTDDLEEVGKTDYHHTFFEMLGNFSFGDYFKKEIIMWSWEFLTKELSIPEEKLWVSVHQDDKEAKKIWIEEIGLLEERIFELEDKSNFWPSDAIKKGPNGPCGPCSEIFYDWGDIKRDGNPKSESDRLSEIWNLVFTQYERKDEGKIIDLPNKNIDTGMGLERIAAILQGKKSNYEIDIFQLILESIDEKIKIKEGEGERNKRYVIADHIRGIVFAIVDGVVPSNEGRGYVIKKLIIDCSEIAIISGIKQPIIYKIVPDVIEVMKQGYPDLNNKQEMIQEMVKSVEKAYLKVRQERIPSLRKEINKINKKELNQEEYKKIGELVFKYKDTYGLTLIAIWEVLEDILITEKDREEIERIYKEKMENQKQQSRKFSKMKGDVFSQDKIDLGVEKTEFCGYKENKIRTEIISLWKNNQRVKEIRAGKDEIKIILKKTTFYAESGGQVGDIGKIITDKGSKIRIQDTQKINDIYIHQGIVRRGTNKRRRNC